MKKTLGVICLLIGMSGAAMATGDLVPEIDPSMAGNALALLAGVLLIIQARRLR